MQTHALGPTFRVGRISHVLKVGRIIPVPGQPEHVPQACLADSHPRAQAHVEADGAVLPGHGGEDGARERVALGAS